MASTDFPPTGRDADTCRPIIAPSSQWDEEDDDRPTSCPPLAVLLGALLGTLVVAWVYVEDHPEVPMAARQATSSLASPTEALEAPEAPATSVAPEQDANGFVAIGGPPGARVFDGDMLVGMAPILHAASAGAHVIRVHHAATGSIHTFAVEVRAHETTPVIITEAAHRAPAKHRTRGHRASTRR